MKDLKLRQLFKALRAAEKSRQEINEELAKWKREKASERKRYLSMVEARSHSIAGLEGALYLLSWCLDDLTQLDGLVFYARYQNDTLTCLTDMFDSRTTKDWVFMKDRSLRYVFANRAMQEGLGLSLREIEGLSDEDLYGVNCAEALREAHKRVLEGMSVSMVHSRCVRGKFLIFVDILLPCRDRNDNIVQIYGISRDATSFYREQLTPPLSKAMTYKSAAMQAVIQSCENAAESDITVLLLGQTGAGKDYTARLIHDKSQRSGGPFINLDCKTIPDTLIESELLGYKAGAFYGATKSKPGRLELAKDGTLFINEIGNLPLDSQNKLLTFFDSKSVYRLGEVEPRPVNARLIVATNKDLTKEIEQGRFKEDLYYRIKQFVIEIPPLRDRLEDLPALVQQVQEDLRDTHAETNIPYIDETILSRFQKYDWPGNVRELKNVILTMAVEGEEALDKLLPPEEQQIGEAAMSPSTGANEDDNRSETGQFTWITGFQEGRNYKKIEKDLRRALFAEALSRADGNIAEAARLLDVDRGQLSRMMKQMGIERDPKSRPEDT